MAIELERHSVPVPVRKFIRVRRIDWGIKLVGRRVREPIRKLIRSSGIDMGIVLVRRGPLLWRRPHLRR